MKGVDTIARIRREFFIRGRSIKEIVRDLHVSRNTVRKVVRTGRTAFEYEPRSSRCPSWGSGGLISTNCWPATTARRPASAHHDPRVRGAA